MPKKNKMPMSVYFCLLILLLSLRSKESKSAFTRTSRRSIIWNSLNHCDLGIPQPAISILSPPFHFYNLETVIQFELTRPFVIFGLLSHNCKQFYSNWNYFCTLLLLYYTVMYDSPLFFVFFVQFYAVPGTFWNDNLPWNYGGCGIPIKICGNN